MNPDLLVYVQKTKDGIFKVWHANASLTPPEDHLCVYADTMRDAALTAAHTYVYGTEYQVCELPNES
jgi:hypothetical protein